MERRNEERLPKLIIKWTPTEERKKEEESLWIVEFKKQRVTKSGTRILVRSKRVQAVNGKMWNIIFFKSSTFRRLCY